MFRQAPFECRVFIDGVIFGNLFLVEWGQASKVASGKRGTHKRLSMKPQESSQTKTCAKLSSTPHRLQVIIPVMSIYATLWKLQFPKDGDLCTDHDWIEVTAQGVPPNIGSPSAGAGYEAGDPYAFFSSAARSG